jgi:Na+-driven multidrug efflux pump
MKRTDQSVLDTDKVGKLLFTQALPAFVAQLVTATYSLVSTIFIGHYVGALGIAGIAIVLPVQFISMGFGNMFGVGGASMISRAIGAGNREKAERTLANAITGVILVSLIILAAGIINQDFVLRLLGASPEILPYAKDYYTIILFGLFFQTLGLALANLVRSEGSARASMLSMILGAVSNVVFDAFFIVFLKIDRKSVV